MIDWTDYRGLIASNIRRSGVQADLVQDLTHDTIIKLTEYEEKNEIDNPAGFATAVAKRAAANHFRTEKNHARLDGEYHTISSTEYGTDGGGTVKDYFPEQQALSKGVSPETQAIQSDLLQKALGSLTVKQANAIFLVDYMGHTFQEGADHRGVSKASFHRTYKRAKEGLKRWAASQR